VNHIVGDQALVKDEEAPCGDLTLAKK